MNNCKTRVNWLLEKIGTQPITPNQLAFLMQQDFKYVGNPTKGGTVEKARQLLTKARRIGYVKPIGRGIWSITEHGLERLSVKDNRKFHGKVSGHTKN